VLRVQLFNLLAVDFRETGWEGLRLEVNHRHTYF